jgi:hypothetical protein
LIWVCRKNRSGLRRRQQYDQVDIAQNIIVLLYPFLVPQVLIDLELKRKLAYAGERWRKTAVESFNAFGLQEILETLIETFICLRLGFGAGQHAGFDDHTGLLTIAVRTPAGELALALIKNRMRMHVLTFPDGRWTNWSIALHAVR